MSEHTRSSTHSERPNEDILLDLNFVPQWAKKAPGENHYHAAVERSTRPARRESDRRPRRSSAPQSAPLRAPRRPARVDLPVTIKFLPEQKRLASLVRQIHHSKRAYPLMDLAHIFLSDPRGHMVKIEVASGAGGFQLYQGRRTKMVATDRAVLLRQILDHHLGDFFEREELDVEVPAGAFQMIGKVDDVLVGPPNHHSYVDRLAEIHRAQYAHLPFERFKERVQIVRDEEAVEQWKLSASKQTIYRLKEGERAFSRRQAEEYLRTHLADREIEAVSRAVLSSSLARRIEDYNLIRMVREAWQQESRFPISLAFSMRAAFRHLHLYTFKAGRNINFVTAIPPDPIRPAAAVDSIREVLEFLADRAGATRQQLVEGLRPGAQKDSPEALEILNPIRWLIEKGHIIEFFNGTLSVPTRRARR